MIWRDHSNRRELEMERSRLDIEIELPLLD